MKKLLIATIALVNIYGSDIVGEGFLKTRAGDVKTCSGNKVYLEKISATSPVTFINLQGLANAYEKSLNILLGMMNKQILDGKPSLPKELLSAVYREKIPKTLKEEIQIVIDNQKDILSLISKYDESKYEITRCDSEGKFEFFDIEPGNYDIGTTVIWDAGNSKQGGFITQSVKVKQKKQKIILTEEGGDSLPSKSYNISSIEKAVSDKYRKEKDEAEAEIKNPGSRDYNNYCAVCHETDAMGAPAVGNKSEWATIVRKDIDTVYLNVLNGIGGMPPKGGTDLSDEKLKEVVNYMIRNSK